jgi:hypothetical protein
MDASIRIFVNIRGWFVQTTKHARSLRCNTKKTTNSEESCLNLAC